MPPIPKRVEAPGGPVIVSQVRKVPNLDGAECWGLYDSSTRRIRILRSLPLRFRWKILYHELVHVALIDAGLDNGIEDRLHEAICDAIATARSREAFG
jgi:hypothetical protein